MSLANADVSNAILAYKWVGIVGMVIVFAIIIWLYYWYRHIYGKKEGGKNDN